MKTSMNIKKIIASSFFIYLLISPYPVSLVSNVYAQLTVSSWPMFGNNPQHTGQSTSVGAERGQKIWEFTTADGPGSSSYRLSPTVGADGTIYFGASKQETQIPYTYQDTGFRLYALTPDGTVKNTYSYTGTNIGSKFI